MTLSPIIIIVGIYVAWAFGVLSRLLIRGVRGISLLRCLTLPIAVFLAPIAFIICLAKDSHLLFREKVLLFLPLMVLSYPATAWCFPDWSDDINSFITNESCYKTSVKKIQNMFNNLRNFLKKIQIAPVK